MNSELEDFISNNKEAFDNRTPDPAVLQRIQQQVQAGKKKERTIVVSMKMVRWAAACFILLAGATVFLLVQKNPATETAAIISQVKIIRPQTTVAAPQPEEKNTEDNKRADQLQAQTAVSAENTTAQQFESHKQILFAKLNDMESPGQRLDAATQLNHLQTAGTDIIDALVKTMNNDPSTNVRLAALEALSKFHRETYVKKQLIASLEKQKDPMVQIGLIELLTKMREKIILTELDKLVNDNNTMDAVKDHAYSGILTLRS